MAQKKHRQRWNQWRTKQHATAAAPVGLCSAAGKNVRGDVFVSFRQNEKIEQNPAQSSSSSACKPGDTWIEPNNRVGNIDESSTTVEVGGRV